MPGAQPRRAPLSRIASTARRGANVPNGVPGVYRVNRPQIISADSDTGSAAPPANDWITPPDREDVLEITRISQYRHEWADTDPDYSTIYSSQAPYTDSYGHAVATRENTALRAAAFAFNTANFTYPQWSPDPSTWPPGATSVEYETTTGTPTGALRIAGNPDASITLDGDGVTHTVYDMGLYRYVRAGYTLSGWQGPGIWDTPAGGGAGNDPDISQLYAGSLLHTFTPPAQPSGAGARTDDYPTYSVNPGSPDAEGWIAFLIRMEVPFADVSPMPISTSYNSYVQGIDMDRNGVSAYRPKLYATYTPPRYRFIY